MKASRLPKRPDGSVIRQELRRAQEALRAARRLLEDDLLDDAVSRAYYAMLHATKAALLTKRITVYSHSAALKMFGLHFVKPGLIEPEYAKSLKQAQSDRAKCDYEVLVDIDRSIARQHIQAAGRFLARLRSYLRKSHSKRRGVSTLAELRRHFARIGVTKRDVRDAIARVRRRRRSAARRRL